ncbi:isopenicillin-N N-acyltransferase [[Emmonsia] crescens]|uniref:Isopenicillin-N N-acyltransferase n=1 Tax=[Emmonsia] crescens TaxID=73230 RepID=A0A0G2J8I0_9EURO|nr:isopenicillin-N N-acyltransferase [Emmonsia crescens UAMH 3008]
MNSLFNAALKQSSALRRDLDAFAESPATTSPAVQGQISASLTSFSRTIDDYSSLSKQELIPAKQELAFERLKNFRTELADYRQLFDRLRKEREDAQSTSNRNELLGRRPHHASTPENPYAQSNLPQSSPFANPNYPHHRSSPSGSGFSGGPADYTRENHALREQSFFSNTNSQLDEFLDRGRAVLGDLGQQREMLKGTQRRLYSVANTLGVSGDTIRTIERRAKQDKWIFWGGVHNHRHPHTFNDARHCHYATRRDSDSPRAQGQCHSRPILLLLLQGTSKQRKGQRPTYEYGAKGGYKYYHTSNDMKCWRSTHPMNDCFMDCCEAEEKKAKAKAYSCGISYDC